MSCRFSTNRFVLALLFLSVASSVRADTNWILLSNQPDDWSRGSNWDNGEPLLYQCVHYKRWNGKRAIVGRDVQVSLSWRLKHGNSTDRRRSLSTTTEYIGYEGAGTVTLSGGRNSSASIYLGYDSAGVLGQSGGTNTISASLCLGYNASASGTYYLGSTGYLTCSSGEGEIRRLLRNRYIRAVWRNPYHIQSVSRLQRWCERDLRSKRWRHVGELRFIHRMHWQRDSQSIGRY